MNVQSVARAATCSLTCTVASRSKHGNATNRAVPGQDIENLTWFYSIVGALAAFAIVGGWLT